MNHIELARALAMKKTRLEAMKREQERAAECREILGAIDADERLIRRSNLRLMNINNGINKIREEIFSLEQQLGITGNGDPEKIPDVG